MTTLIEVAVRGSFVLLMGLVAYAALRRQAPGLRHALLAATLCAAPLAVPLGALLPPITVTMPRAVMAPSSMPTLNESAVASVITPAERAVAPVAVAAAPAPIRLPLGAIAVIVWALGSVIALGVLALSLLRLTRVTRSAAEVGRRQWQEALVSASRAAGLQRPVVLRESPREDLLATWGWRRAYLLLPPDALDWPRQRIDVVLGHELAHVRRNDWAWQVYATVIRALFWWNPLAWVIAHRLAIESERACDDAVLAQGVAAHAYAGHLVAIARNLHHRTPDAVAMPMARPSTLHRRITAMLNPDIPRAAPSRTTIGLAIASLLLLVAPVSAIRGTTAQAPLEGVVYDPTGAVVPEVKLMLDGDGKKAETTTDAEGRFAFPGVAPGRYELEATQMGFRALKQTIDLRQPSDWTRLVTLQLGAVQESISVKGRRGSGASASTGGPVRVRVGGNIRPPRKTKDVKPIYPEALQEAGVDGLVNIEAVIGQDGNVAAARVTSTQVHPDLAGAAVTAVRQWKFEPTLLNGAPVEVVMNVAVSFTLE
jgi:TonB family protein